MWWPICDRCSAVPSSTNRLWRRRHTLGSAALACLLLAVLLALQPRVAAPDQRTGFFPHAIALADFNRDGIDEIFFRHQVSGSNRLWTIEDGARTSSEVVRSVSTDWFIIGMGDFDADGDADLIWRNGVTGSNRYWEMQGTTRLRSVAIRSVGLTWSVVGSGDFDGDGRDDLFWRSSTGSNVVWLMQSEVIATRGSLPRVSSAWEVSGIGDFDGDGMDDVLWRNASTGSNSIWLLNGAERKSRASIPRASLAWRVFGVFDMNGDGMSDILLRKSNGSNRLWLMNGTTRTASLAVTSNPDQNWEPVAVGNTSTVEGVPDVAVGGADAAVFFASNISTPLIQSRCIACHIEGGVATASALRYTPDAVSGHETSNFQLLQGYVAADQAAANTILEKVRGVNHGGGLQLSSDSEDYQSLVEFLGLLGAEIDDTNIPTLGDFWQGVSLASAAQTLRRAALIVAGRLPTEEELAAVESGDEAMLGQTIRGLMTGDNFHDFLTSGANDRLFTDAFLNSLYLEVAELRVSRLFPIGANKYYFDPFFPANVDKVFSHASRSISELCSNKTAPPCPPPMQRLAIPFVAFFRFKIFNKCNTIRAPLAPTGCPMAIAPPSIFNRF